MGRFLSPISFDKKKKWGLRSNRFLQFDILLFLWYGLDEVIP